MPKIVNVEERRGELAAAVLALVSEKGVDGLTVRSVAERAGMSAGLVHHYFPAGKSALLHAAVSMAVARGVERMLGVMSDRRGIDAVNAAALELLPVTPQRRAEWMAWASLWSEILSVDDLLHEQRDRLVAWRAALEILLTQAVGDGELDADVETRVVALQLAAFLDGLGLHALVDPALLPPDVMEAQVATFVSTVTK